MGEESTFQPFATPSRLWDPKALALKVHRVGFQGNTEPEDSWRYRGRGLAWLEGRYEYERYGKALKIDLLEMPDLALNPVVGAHLALEAYFGNNFRSRVSPHLNDEKTDWDGATTVLRRVAHKKGVSRRARFSTSASRNLESTYGPPRRMGRPEREALEARRDQEMQLVMHPHVPHG